MNEDQPEAWRKALANKAAAGRKQRYRPRKKALVNVRGAGMVRIPPRQQRTEKTEEKPPSETG
jgi:hypothetical protein